jgi:hypothetical protein
LADPADALTKFRRQLPGEQGLRNVLRGDGSFTIDMSLSKSFAVGIAILGTGFDEGSTRGRTAARSQGSVRTGFGREPCEEPNPV